MARNSDSYRELLKGTTPTLILAVVAAGPLHGYAIARTIEQRSGDMLSLGEGSLYPALHALERDGLLTSHWETPASGPARKVYMVTDSGRDALNKRMDMWHHFSAAITTVLEGSGSEQPA